MLEASGTSIPLRRLPDPPVTEPARLRAQLRHFHREQDIYGQEERSDTWYRVVSSSARKYLMRADGRRQLVDIYLPGDLFGFTARLHHRFAVQAVAEGTLIACYPRQRVEALANEDTETALEIRMQTFGALERLQEQLMVTGTMTAQEKVREFLFYFHRRLSADKDVGMALPISRYDIADMLGISLRKRSAGRSPICRPEASSRWRVRGASGSPGDEAARVADGGRRSRTACQPPVRLPSFPRGHRPDGEPPKQRRIGTGMKLTTVKT